MRFENFLKFISYLSVDIIAVILPIALGVSTAFVFQRFNESNQSIALQAAGIPPRTVLIPLLQMVTMVICYLYISNSYISPYAWREFRTQEFNIKNNINPPEKAGTIFSKDGFSVYAQQYMGDFFFGNLFVIDNRTPDKVYSYSAESGTILNNVLVLTKGERIEIDFKSHKNSVVYFQSHNYDLSGILSFTERQIHPNEKHMDELLENNENEELHKTQVALFHQKMTSPLLAAVFSLLSFLLIFLAPYRRKSSPVRMIILMTLIVALQGSYFWIANAAAKDPKFINLNYILVASCLFIITTLIIRKSRPGNE